MSLLADYRPNFCCECGAKIVRLRWRLWTNRRFCDQCNSRSGKTLRLRRLLIPVVFLALGLLIGRGFTREPQTLVIERPTGAPAQQTEASTAAQPPVTVEQTYICGARTKKGTPCSRRVRGPVRCWQHKGAPAMLPVEKLIVKE